MTGLNTGTTQNPPDLALSESEVLATRLLSPDALREVIVAHAATLGTTELPVAASSWAKHYVAPLLREMLPAVALRRQIPDMAAENVLVRLEAGTPRAIRFVNPTPHAPEDVRAWAWRRLFGEHLAPVFDTLEQAAGISRGILWNSVGNYCVWFFDELAKDATALHAQEDRAALLEAVELPGVTGPNPLRDPVRYECLDEPGLPPRVQVRRTCCLKDRIPGKPPCYSCPRISRDERIRLVRAAGEH